MRLFFKKFFRENTRTLLQHCGYHFTGIFKGEPGFARRLSRNQYPQFHIYVNKDDAQELILNLHFDAKRPSYSGSSMHSGEYETEIVKEEAERVKGFIAGLKVG